MNKSSIKGLIAIFLVVCVSMAVVLINYMFLRVPSNPPDTVGNTAGNLNNHGLFCEQDGRVYFSNPNDNNYIYSMSVSGDDYKMIQASPAEYINVAGKYIYYYQRSGGGSTLFGVAGNSRGIFTKKISSKATAKCYDRTTAGLLNLIGDELYYVKYNTKDGFSLANVSINGDEKSILSESTINPACYYGGSILYPDIKDHFYLSRFDLSSGEETHISSIRAYNICPEGNYIYYMNIDDNYRLYRYNMADGTAYKLTDDRVDCFNILGGIIIYQKNDADYPGIIRMHADGANPEVLATGNYTNINMTSSYTYFSPFEDESVIYMVSTYGGSSVGRFDPPYGE